ncbi:hypothetical protein [Bacillus cereus]|nr:hypothetical protein [Bacillus cereus]
MPIYYKEEEYKKILEGTDKEQKVFMPNEIFQDLIKVIDVKRSGRSSKHIAYAFSYVYLITYLYRYAKFGGDFDFSEEELKKLLTVSPTSKGKNGVNYITKRDGVLEKLGYIEKVTDYPITYHFLTIDKEIEFVYVSEMIEQGVPIQIKEKFKNSKNKKVNYPVKYLDNRVVKFNGDEWEQCGILYDVSYTTEIELDIFIYCMSRKELGVEGFYLYSFIKFMNGFYGGGWNCSLAEFPQKTGMRRDVIKSRLKSLEEYGMLYTSHEKYIVGLESGSNEKTKANEYSVREYHNFVRQGEVKRFYQRGKIIGFKQHEESLKDKKEAAKIFKDDGNDALW